ncbi:MAG: hypothetical protein RLY86_232 [Pseudomonadota bacterium]|jgi:hypothetical protein
MGEPDSIFDMVDEARKAEAIAEAEAAYARGEYVEHAVAVTWMEGMIAALHAGRPLPPVPGGTPS